MSNSFGLVRKGSGKHNGLVRAASKRIDAIAREHGADFICASIPGSDLIGWFDGPIMPPPEGE